MRQATQQRWFPALALALSAVTAPAGAATLEETKIYNWTAGAYTNDQSGRFTNCAMSVAYKSGITLLFSIDTKYDWAMALVNQNWNLKVGDTYGLQLAVDGVVTSASSKVLTPKMLGVQLQDTSDLFNTFRRGRLLVVSSGRDRFNFALDGTSDGLSWLLRCVKRYEGYSAPVANNAGPSFGGANRVDPPAPLPPAAAILNSPTFRAPPAPAPQPPVVPPPAPPIEARAPTPPPVPVPAPGPSAAAAPPIPAVPEATARSISAPVEASIFLASLMASAGVTDYRVMTPSEVPEKYRGAAIVFGTSDGMVGSVRILAADTARAAGNQIIAADAQACSGQYASGSLPATGGRSDVAHVFTGCDQTGTPAAARYSVIARGKGGFFVVGLYAPGTGSTGERLKQVDGSIREATSTIVGRF